MSNWDKVREDICEISIIFHDAVNTVWSKQQKDESQKEELKKRAQRYGLHRIANEIHNASNKKQCAEEIVYRLIKGNALIGKILCSMLGLLLLYGVFLVLNYFFSIETLAKIVCCLAGIGLFFDRGERAGAICMLIISGICIYFFGFDIVAKVIASIVGIVLVIAILVGMWDIGDKVQYAGEAAYRLIEKNRPIMKIAYSIFALLLLYGIFLVLNYFFQLKHLQGLLQDLWELCCCMVFYTNRILMLKRELFVCS